ncbi:MAG: hypothetical protein IT267_00365 [Saprospiraceae bacterium]|nr:hypothetical protein [Saprospiraceae bacterium]
MSVLILRSKLIFIFLILLIRNPTSAQPIDELLSSYLDNNSKGYLQPLSDLLSANMNTGIREWSRVDSSFHIRLGFLVMSSFPTSPMRTFTGSTGLGFEPSQSVKVPTIIGRNEAVKVDGINGTAFVFPVGYNLKYLPLAVPQLSLEGIYHTELSLRFFSFDLENDFGKIQYFGLGARHGLNHYLKKFPFDLSVGYFYQKINSGESISSTNHLISGYIGRSNKRFSAQLMLAYQSTSTEYSYNYSEDNQLKTYKVLTSGKYPFIAELSGAVKLWVFNIHAAASYAGPITATLGLGIRI